MKVTIDQMDQKIYFIWNNDQLFDNYFVRYLIAQAARD